MNTVERVMLNGKGPYERELVCSNCYVLRIEGKSLVYTGTTGLDMDNIMGIEVVSAQKEPEKDTLGWVME